MVATAFLAVDVLMSKNVHAGYVDMGANITTLERFADKSVYLTSFSRFADKSVYMAGRCRGGGSTDVNLTSLSRFADESWYVTSLERFADMSIFVPGDLAEWFEHANCLITPLGLITPPNKSSPSPLP